MLYKWNLAKLNSFCIAKETMNKTRQKRHPSEWEKIFHRYFLFARLILLQ